MKKVFLMMVLGVLGMPQSVAQEYVPFVREGVQWVCTYEGNPFTLELKGDVEIDGKTYKAMHKYSGDGINTANDTIPVYLREENKVVYGIVPDGKTYIDCPIGIEYDLETTEKIVNGQEFILYDFNDPIGFMKQKGLFPQRIFLVPDKATVLGKQVRRYIFINGSNICLVVGIGYDGLGKGSPLAIQPYTITERGHLNLSHVIENGEIIYTSEIHKTVDPSDSYVPIIREGVQWVNERVTINKGDTTYSYYSYEFNGENWRGYPICYSYTGDCMENSQDLVEVATFVTSYDAAYNNREYRCFSCDPLVKVIDEGRSMLYRLSGNMDLWPLYCFSNHASDIVSNYTPNYFIYYEGGDIFSRENFVEIEPVFIDGQQCSRFAYLDEEGNPLAYVVEGIGFDSYDMGDLLTPFTCKPDPDADYQEYCGLSHVIKDGEIIYKGMRFDPDKVYGIPGDMNGDGTLTIDDLTLLIDYLLTDKPRYSYTGDVTGNGSVGIDDVTALIDLLLRAD